MSSLSSASDQSIEEVFGLKTNTSRFFASEDLLSWFAVDEKFKIDDLVNDFWGLKTKSRLVAVTQDIKDEHWTGLVSEWDSFTGLAGQFRIDKNLVNSMLDLSLGKRSEQTAFKLKNLTALELSIFENFFVEVENFWRDFWRVAEANAKGNFTYLIWVLELDDQKIGSLAIGVPPGLSAKHLKNTDDQDGKTWSKEKFYSLAMNFNLEVPMDLSVGKTKVKIGDLRELEPDDILLFEDSDIKRLWWDKNDLYRLFIHIELPAKDNTDYPNLYYDDLEELSQMTEENNVEDLLIDLPVELTAQFKSVNMPLQKLVELEAGGVLPLGLLLDSQLTLMAPGNKPIAQGELVVLGNQFGMKIQKTNLKSTSYPKAKLSAVPQVSTPRLAEPRSNQAASGFDDLESNLQKELEDVGIDPKELDELEDLY
jgi:flagellar motor switch/type III secretory pathway protein FliN